MGIMVADVHRDDRQFDSMEQLKESIWNAWDKPDLQTVIKLLKSMPTRITGVFLNRGGTTSY